MTHHGFFAVEKAYGPELADELRGWPEPARTSMAEDPDEAMAMAKVAIRHKREAGELKHAVEENWRLAYDKARPTSRAELDLHSKQTQWRGAVAHGRDKNIYPRTPAETALLAEIRKEKEDGVLKAMGPFGWELLEAKK